MYCILVTGIPAAGKSTMAEVLAEQFRCDYCYFNRRL